MRNLKKILALVLALVMSMSLVTIANASDFTDADDITYEEAADVMSTIGVIEGFEDGSFDPHGTLTREQAAKLVTYMLLGDNAERLGIERSTFKDVAVTRWSAPAIEYCVSLGIIDGAGDGNFYPAGQLTGAAFAKVLLTAIGYDSQKEGLVGSAWSVNVSALAAEVGLDNGIEDLSWSAPITREEAAQMALNAICAPLVTYENDATITVNGAEVSIASGDAYYVTTTLAKEQRISDRQLSNSNDYTVEFGEKYFPRLRLVRETDDFERPSHTWVYENTELGTYVDYDLLTETYTEAVTGRQLYELLGKSTIDKYGLTYYVDGVVNTTIDAKNMIRGNNVEYNTTGNGVLTQVFVDHDDEEIVITSINTYLAQANSNYNSTNETLSLKVFQNDDTGTTKIVNVADVPNIADITQDQFVLVNLSGKGLATGAYDVVKVSDVQILSDSTITKFTKASATKIASKLTVDGEEYSASQKAFYDKDVLDVYDQQLLTDMSYNVYLDQYGYAIGVDLFEGTKNYVFITGYDRGTSHISIKTATAGAIFLDGTMKEITVNVTDTNKNIDRMNNNTNDNGASGDYYFTQWSGDGKVSENRWYTYTENNGTYTLRPCATMFATNITTDPTVIKSAYVYLDDSLSSKGRAYGNDESIYLTVEAGHVDMSQTATAKDAITDVNGLYTGVQNVEIELTANTKQQVPNNIYTLYNNDRYIIASIVLGEAQGSVNNYAYILGSAKSEELRSDGYYYWQFDAVVGGEKVTLTAKTRYSSVFTGLKPYHVQELRYDGEYVTDVRDVDSSKFVTAVNQSVNNKDIYDVGHAAGSGYMDACTVGGCAQLSGSRINGTIVLEGRTLYTSYGAGDVGLALASDAKAVLIQNEGTTGNLERKVSNCGSVSEAIGRLADANTLTAGTQFQGRIVAVLNSAGVAQWVVIISDTPLVIGGGNVPSGGNYSDTVNGYTVNIALVDTPANLSTIGTRAALAVSNAGYRNAMPAFLTGATPDSANGVVGGYLMAYDQSGNMVYFTVTYSNYWTIKVDGVTMETVLHNQPSKIYTSTKLLSGKGSGYTLNGTYKNYSLAPNLSTGITSTQVMETGYAKLTGGAAEGTNGYKFSSVNTDDSLTLTNVKVSGSDYIFKVADGLTATYKIEASNSVTGNQNVTLALTGGAGAVVNSATQMMTETAYETVGSTLSWTINTSNLTTDITGVTVTASNVPQSRNISYGSDASAKGLTAHVTGVTSAMDGETVTVTVQVTGTASDNATLSMTGVTGTWVSGSWGAGVTPSGSNISFATGLTYNVTLQYQFTVSGSNPSGAITAGLA